MSWLRLAIATIFIAACAHSAGATGTFDAIKSSYRSSDDSGTGPPWCGVKTRASTTTITMQLAGPLDEDLKRNAGGRSVVQKIGQT